MKWLRNLFVPKSAFLVVMYKDGQKDERRIFLDKNTMNRWVKYMRDDGYEFRGFVETLPIITNNMGN